MVCKTAHPANRRAYRRHPMRAAILGAEGVVFGLLLGSILCSAAWRWPRGMSMLTAERSRCDACGTRLANGDLVPVYSWLRLRGRCRTCGQAISPAYPCTEIAFGTTAGVATSLEFGGLLPALVIALGAALSLLAVVRRA